MSIEETQTMLQDTNSEHRGPHRAARVLIIDDHTLFRKGVRLLLEGLEEIEVVGEAEDGASGIELYNELQPDVVLLDMYLPDGYGHEVARKLKEFDTAASIVVLSAFHSEELLREALEAGASGYILKNADNEELVAAIRHARQGQYHLCPETLSEVVNAFLKASRSAQELCLTQLTTREREIFDLEAQDLKNKTIAEKCFISVKTVEKHKSNIIRKLQLASAAELRSFALTSKRSLPLHKDA